jgi:peroxiredoxin Q/BCP
VVIGASFDPPDENKAFAVQQELPYALLSDQTGAVADAYGVRRPPGSRWEMYPERRTFLIDRRGVIRKIYDVTDVFAHPDDVLADIRAFSDVAAP